MSNCFTSKHTNMPVWLVIAAALVSVWSFTDGRAASAAADQKTFASAEAAAEAVAAAARNNDLNALTAIFGEGGRDILFSGDPVADKQGRALFAQAYDEKHTLVPGTEGTVLVIGTEEWPFPIPVVKKGESWLFDTERGRQEILNRRIGQNELNAIQVCLGIVEAQRKYLAGGSGGSGHREYAQKFRSDPGKRNGLYWRTYMGEDPSPLGAFVAAAGSEGYRVTESGAKPSAYHGYYYRILTAQGKHAPGGAMTYMVNGRMSGGFAAVAYPAEYGVSGVMTFIVSHDGIVYQKNLGADTTRIAQGMKVYDPDPSWRIAN